MSNFGASGQPRRPRVVGPTTCMPCGRPRGYVPAWAPVRDIFACRREGDIAQLARVIETGAEPDVQNSRGESPACIAADKGHESLLRYLHSQVCVRHNACVCARVAACKYMRGPLWCTTHAHPCINIIPSLHPRRHNTHASGRPLGASVTQGDDDAGIRRGKRSRWVREISV